MMEAGGPLLAFRAGRHMGNLKTSHDVNVADLRLASNLALLVIVVVMIIKARRK
jgi:hypothetical protein